MILIANHREIVTFNSNRSFLLQPCPWVGWLVDVMPMTMSCVLYIVSNYENNTILDWGWDGWSPSQHKIAGKKSSTSIKELKFYSKLCFSGRWNVHTWIAEGTKTGGSLQGENQPGKDFIIILNFVLISINFRYLRSHLAVLVMRNVWKCSKIKYQIIYLHLST